MTTAPRSARLLMLSSLLLAVAGLALVGMPHGQEPPAAVAAPTTQATTDSSPAAAAPVSGTPTAHAAATATPATSTSSAAWSAWPLHGEGAAGDQVVRRNLVAAWPADLPAADERELLCAGRALLRADATGVGRAKWPTIFGDSGQAVAPGFATARFRIQAAIARRDHSPDKAVVHLVWAGRDRGGTFTDLRLTDWHFTRTTSKKGAASWTPQPRTRPARRTPRHPARYSASWQASFTPPAG